MILEYFIVKVGEREGSLEMRSEGGCVFVVSWIFCDEVDHLLVILDDLHFLVYFGEIVEL